MQNVFFVHDLKAKGKDYLFFVSKDYKVGVKRLSDGVVYLSNLNPFNVGSFLLSCLAEQTENIVPRLLDQEAKKIKDDKIITNYPIIFSIYPVKKRNEIVFPLKTVPVFLNIQDYQNNALISIALTAIDVMQIYCKIINSVNAPTNYLIAGTLLLNHDGVKLTCQIGGSEKVEIDEDFRKTLIMQLRRWLSGIFIEKDPANTNRNRRAYCSKKGFVFNGTNRPTIICNNIRTPFLTYYDMAELLIITEIMRGRELEQKEEDAEKQNVEEEIEFRR